MILNSLGNFLGRQIEHVRQMKDPDHAIDVINIAVESTSPNDPDRSRWPNNFGAWLRRRIGERKAMEDLNRAIDVTDMAMSTSSLGTPESINNSGTWIYRLFEEKREIGDLIKAKLLELPWKAHSFTTRI
jgi:hypothetical protein